MNARLLVIPFVLVCACNRQAKDQAATAQAKDHAAAVAPSEAKQSPALPSAAPSTTGTTPAAPPAAALAAVPAKITPYSVSPDLKEVVNLTQFNKNFRLSPEVKAILAKQLFAATATQAEQMFHIYEENEYRRLPSFVSTDVVLQLFHVFYSFTLRRAEADAFLPALERLTDGMLQASLSALGTAKDPGIGEAAKRNAAYFGVAARLLGKKPTLPAEVEPLVTEELKRIEAHAGKAEGVVTESKVDYTQFIPRGHYTRSNALERYFRAMMWYGQVAFPTQPEGSARQVLLLVHTLTASKRSDDWQAIYEPTSFFVGAADDLTPTEVAKVAAEVFGANAVPAAFSNADQLRAFAEKVKRLRPPRITKNATNEAPALRFMGQRFIPDSEVLAQLSGEQRPFPSGLDVVAVLGSPRAVAVLDGAPEIYNASGWRGYQSRRRALTDQFAALPDATWTSNLYYGWLGALRALLEPTPPGYPSFMHSPAWADKSLASALGSWTELRHDTILYGKQSGAECGGDEQEPPTQKGYVEPNVVFYERLRALTAQTREGLAKRRLLSDDLKSRFERFEDLLVFLATVSRKELLGKELSAEEYATIRTIGGQIEYLTLSVIDGAPDSWTLVSEADRDMALVADVHSAMGKVLEEAVGHPYAVLVIVPVAGKLQLTRGAVFSTYEFLQPVGDRLTDEAWQKMVKEGKLPAPPAWTRSYLVPAPLPPKPPVETYSSGC
jgi:hypothetical protein